jgi:hypothetical protein
MKEKEYIHGKLNTGKLVREKSREVFRESNMGSKVIPNKKKTPKQKHKKKDILGEE